MTFFFFFFLLLWALAFRHSTGLLKLSRGCSLSREPSLGPHHTPALTAIHPGQERGPVMKGWALKAELPTLSLCSCDSGQHRQFAGPLSLSLNELIFVSAQRIVLRTVKKCTRDTQNGAWCTQVFDQLPAWSPKTFDLTSARRCELNYIASIIH